MALVSRHCSVSKATASCSGRSPSWTSYYGTTSRSRRSSVVRNSYQTDTDTQPRAPDAAPGRWGAAPPPPPPPPPPPKQPVTGGAPSRREAMFGLLGAALGVGVTTAYYKAQYPDDPESFQEALDQLLDDPDFLEAVADELLYQEYEDVNADVNSGITKMRNKLLTDQVETAEAEGASK